ncbi:MAG: GTP cyclohydrolase II, partial [Rhodobacteraceae bacterium]|nr:GTP cyclohydrolase II [Paracoccaceae bacterium]
MTLSPNPTERLARARGDLRMGVPVLITHAGTAALVIAVEVLTPTRLAAMAALGPLVLALTSRRADTLKARAYDGDLARIVVPQGADVAWLRALADPAGDLRHPMKGPLHSLRDDGVDAALARAAIGLAKSAHLLPAALVVAVPGGPALAQAQGLTLLPAADVSDSAAPHLRPVVHARLPMVASAAGRVHIFRPDDGAEEHYAIE